MNVPSEGENFYDRRLLKSDDRFIVRDKSERALSLKDDTGSASCSHDFLRLFIPHVSARRARSVK